MVDNVPVSGADGPAAGQVDRAALGTAFPRTRSLLLLEFGDRAEFDDPRREWRRLFSELLGTFAGAGRNIAAAAAKGQMSLVGGGRAAGSGAIILFMGAVSGGA